MQSYDYTPYGAVARSNGSTPTDYQYARLFAHPTSGLNLSATRAQDGVTGRWLNRDPIRELGGVNLYAYVAARPTIRTDHKGLEFGIGGGGFYYPPANSIPDWPRGLPGPMTPQEQQEWADYFEQTGTDANYASLGFLVIPGAEAGFPIMQGVSYCSSQISYLLEPNNPQEQSWDLAAGAYAAMKQLDEVWAVIQASWPVVKGAFGAREAQ